MAYNPYENKKITSAFGERIDPVTGESSYHHGIDYAMTLGEYIYSLTLGKVIDAGFNEVYGNYAIIDNNSGYTFRYAHMDELDVKTGDSVAPATIIGKAGSTGKSTGPHLHLEVKKGDEYIDPIGFLKSGIDDDYKNSSSISASNSNPVYSSSFLPISDSSVSSDSSFTNLIIGFYFMLLFLAGFFAFSKVKEPEKGGAENV